MREVGFQGTSVRSCDGLRGTVVRYVFADFLEKLGKGILKTGRYQLLGSDCWHTIARLEDEKAATAR